MRRRGSALVVTLLMSLCILALALGLFEQSKELYRGASDLTAGERARAIAWAGLEDARLKLAMDPDFPPRLAVDQNRFSYGEPFDELDGSPLGFYQVELDTTWSQTHRVMRVGSVGLLGSLDNPLARVRLTADLDLEEARSTRFRWIHFQDGGTW